MWPDMVSNLRVRCLNDCATRSEAPTKRNELNSSPRGVLDEILNLIESVSEGFLPTFVVCT